MLLALFILGVLILLVGVVALFRGSWPTLGISNRKVAAVVLVVGLVLTLVAMPRAAEPPEEEEVVELEPGISLAKTGPAAAEPGDDIVFEFTVTNTGEAGLQDVVLTDPLFDDNDQEWEYDEIADLQAGESYAFESPEYTVPEEAAGEDVVNTARVTAMTEDEEEITATAEHVVSIEKAIEPVSYTYQGTGDETLTFTPPEAGPVVFRIQGNAEGEEEFEVASFDVDGNSLETLVATTRPYEGVVYDQGKARRLDIRAVGAWTVEIRALRGATHVEVPGDIEGSGDYVFRLDDEAATASISGNEEAEYFAVFTYNDGEHVLVETEDPYQGRVRVSEEARVVVVKAVGEWTMAFE